MQFQGLRLLRLTVVFITFVVLGCGGSKQVNLAPPASSKMIDTAPEWYIDPPKHPDYLYSSNSATSRDMQLAVDKAKQAGMAGIAAGMQAQMSGLTKRFDEEVGLGEDSELLVQFTQGAKSVVDQTLTGVRIEKKEIYKEPNDIYRAYVLVSMPIGAANIALMEKIRANEHMYTRLRSSETFKELEQEVEKYRHYQAEQEAKVRSLSRGQQ